MKNEELYGSFVKAREDRFVAREALGGLIGSCREAPKFRDLQCQMVAGNLSRSCQRHGHFRSQRLSLRKRASPWARNKFFKNMHPEEKMANGYRPTRRMSECKPGTTRTIDQNGGRKKRVETNNHHDCNMSALIAFLKL